MDIYERVKAFYKEVEIEKRIIGKSTFGRDVYAMKVGFGTPCGIAQYAIHGREYITALLAIEQYKIGVYKGSCWFIPLVNPDGALLSQIGISSVEDERTRLKLMEMNGGSFDFSLWKANGRGVDLNVNFSARWGTGVKNVTVAGRENYIGPHPFSETESLALKRFTENIRPDYTVSYHTKGEEIYWRFHQDGRREIRDKRLAETLAKVTGYPLKEAEGSVGGYKDWCVEKLLIPSFTLEAGDDKWVHPLDERALEEMVNKNGRAIWELSKAMEG